MKVIHILVDIYELLYEVILLGIDLLQDFGVDHNLVDYVLPLIFVPFEFLIVFLCNGLNEFLDFIRCLKSTLSHHAVSSSLRLSQPLIISNLKLPLTSLILDLTLNLILCQFVIN